MDEREHVSRERIKKRSSGGIFLTMARVRGALRATIVTLTFLTDPYITLPHHNLNPRPNRRGWARRHGKASSTRKRSGRR